MASLCTLHKGRGEKERRERYPERGIESIERSGESAEGGGGGRGFIRSGTVYMPFLSSFAYHAHTPHTRKKREKGKGCEEGCFALLCVQK
jgi:hypothetical protein